MGIISWIIASISYKKFLDWYAENIKNGNAEVLKSKAMNYVFWSGFFLSLLFVMAESSTVKKFGKLMIRR